MHLANNGLFRRQLRWCKAQIVLATLYVYSLLVRRTVLVVAEKYGRLGNRIYLASHIMAFAQRGGFVVLLPALEEYVHFFRDSDQDLFCRFPAGRTPFLSRIPFLRKRYYSLLWNAAIHMEGKPDSRRFKTIRIPEDQELVLGAEQVLQTARQHNVLFFCGWRFHDFEALSVYADKVRSYFRPPPRHEADIAAPVAELRAKAEVLIAIAIRHGDYRDFAGGRYFFETKDYAALMRRLAALFPSQRVGFLICSDEDQDTTCFADMIYFFRPFHPLENVFSIARCDYVVTSPSSYAGSAAFLGNIPILFVKNINDEVALSDFGPSRLVPPE